MAEQEVEQIYGQGIAKVIEPRAQIFQDQVDDIKYKAQLLARETKLSSGVLATVSMGFAIGFVLAIVMMIGPFFIFQGGL